MISKWTRDTVSSLSTRSFSGALPTRNASPAITSSVPRCAPLITTSLQRRRLTVAGVASRRIRVPVRCSIMENGTAITLVRLRCRRPGEALPGPLAPPLPPLASGSPAGFLVWWIQREYVSGSAAFVRGICTRRVARRRRGQLPRRDHWDHRRDRDRPTGARQAVGRAPAVVPRSDDQRPA